LGKLGPEGASRAEGLRRGWAYILNVWAGRRTKRVAIMDGIVGVLNLIQKIKGSRDAEIARAGGQILS